MKHNVVRFPDAFSMRLCMSLGVICWKKSFTDSPVSDQYRSQNESSKLATACIAKKNEGSSYQPSSTILSFSIRNASTKQVSLGSVTDRRAHRTPLGLAYLLRYQVRYEGDRRFNGGLTDWKVALVRKSGDKVLSTSHRRPKNGLFAPTKTSRGNHVT